MGPQDGYFALGSLTPSSTTGAEVKTQGCESVAYQVKTVDSSPQVKAYGANPGGTFIPVRYRLITVAGVESLIDPDTASGALSAGDRIIVPNNGYDQIRISTTTGTMTADATRNFYGGVQYEIQKLIDGGITATVTPPAVQLHTMICDTTNENLISASARKLWGIEVFSLDATPVYVKLYDKATAPSESDTPIYRSGTPSNATAANGAGRQAGPWPVYVALTNGLGIRVVTGLTDASDGALTADEVIVNVWWSA